MGETREGRGTYALVSAGAAALVAEAPAGMTMVAPTEAQYCTREL